MPSDEFDWWQPHVLGSLVSVLKTRMPDLSMTPPPVEEEGFWKEAASACGMLNDDDEDPVDTARTLALDVHSEFQHCVASHCGAPDLWCGDLTSSESRLALLTLGIKGVVYIASHAMEPLWEADGIAYETFIVSPAIEPSKTITSQLGPTIEFMRNHSPTLVCSSSTSLCALVCAARLSVKTTMPPQDILTQLDELGIETTMCASERDELDAFCSTHLLSTPRVSSSGEKRERDDQWTLCDSPSAKTVKMPLPPEENLEKGGGARQRGGEQAAQ